jgi:hypothetical protein
MKKIIWVITILAIGAIGVYLFNYFSLQTIVYKKISVDNRNNGIEVRVHYKNFIILNTLVFDIRKISSDKAPIDVFRVFLQSSEGLKDKNFQKVNLASKGKTKFLIKGEYLKTLGQEYEFQNPVYTARTFPENLLLKTGQAAYSQWTGGLLGVTSKQMEDFEDACTKWFLEDFK